MKGVSIMAKKTTGVEIQWRNSEINASSIIVKTRNEPLKLTHQKTFSFGT